MRADDRLAGFDDVGVGFALQFVGYEEQEEASLEQVDAEELGEQLALHVANEGGTYEWHEGEIRVELKDLVECFGG